MPLHCSAAPNDSVTYGWEQITTGWNLISQYVGGDLFVQGEAYSFHFSRVGFFSSSGGAGLGAEFRVAPVFIGGVIGTSNNEIPRLPSGFYSSSLYAGFTIDGWRIELGKVYGETSSWSTHPPPLAVYKSYFAGIGRRYGAGFFFEPEIKLMFPVVATYYYNKNEPGIAYMYPYDHTALGLDNCGLRDLFFALTVRVGIGFGADH
ncbi:MAG: hypothetical protein M1469_00075 [Bacteroidetes bacterium]|nr:hypothetical protein [Bacteroidota bacterium]